MTKKHILTVDNKHFYDDYTYRCDHWRSDDFSSIKIVDNDVLFKHSDSLYWGSMQAEMPKGDIDTIKCEYEKYTYKIMEEAFLEVDDDKEEKK